jgi:hypothetical protein
MGHNIDLEQLLRLPKFVRCTECKEMTPTNFDEYDIDCGEPNAKDGKMTLDIQCAHCENDIKYEIMLTLPKQNKKEDN